MGLRRKNKSPAVLSHEFVIQNHADAVSCLAMGLLLGLMFEVTAKYVIIFITVQYNVTYATNDKSEHIHFYDYGPKDIATVVFYMLIAIILHAVIQEYVLDEEFMMNPTSLWKNYPHSRMRFQVKFFYICQIAYWLHALPELYFQKIRKEDVPRQLCYICLYIAHISGAYILNLQHLGLILMVPHYLVELIFHASRLFYFSDENKQKGFTIWALLFVMARLLTLTLSVLTFGFGLARVENPDFSIAAGNFNVLTVRISCLTAICLTQAWMMWKFINFQLKKWREHIQNQIPKKKITNTKSKPTKREPNRANFVNGAAKLEDGTSPRIRKSKPV
ncbi:translocating chain-associated membrane protein 1-like isoform X5 [Apteryx rowi]|uniref:translocating chain-associated membrane protein 1-like isoform X5 n=1 Tax=Apteryx rowi TaxID=308060 RepID=UPI000E1CC467|nr:translocating chain-associated membrane protein 1-like isoform X5 [Apteryx rowi]